MSAGLPMPALLVIPLGWAVLALLVNRRGATAVNACGLVLLTGAATWLWIDVLHHGPQGYALGGWATPLGIALRLDGLAASFVLLTAAVATASGFQALRAFRDQDDIRDHFWPVFWLLWAGLNTVWLSGDLFNLYVGLELTTLSAVSLVALRSDAPSLAAALRYLLAALSGSLAYLLGVALLYGTHGVLALDLLALQVTPGPTLALALALMAVGLAVKTALFPLHGWLPPAHGGALAPVSALLSGLVVKASFYVAWRVWHDLGDAMPAMPAAQMLGALGAGAVLWGGWMAWRQEHLKQVVAYSTVAQIGFLFLVFPLTTGLPVAAAELARNGIVLLAVSHGLAKAALFLAAGNLVQATGSERVDALAGASRLLPVSLFSFALAGISLMGLPPSGGFAGKWLLLQGAVASGQWWWLPVPLGGGVLTAAYIFRVLRCAYGPAASPPPFRHPHWTLEVAPLLLATGALLVGVMGRLPLAVLGPMEAG